MEEALSPEIAFVDRGGCVDGACRRRDFLYFCNHFFWFVFDQVGRKRAPVCVLMDWLPNPR